MLAVATGLAAGAVLIWLTGGDPILIDMSASITTNGMAARLKAAGSRFPGQWAQDADGNATDEPGVIFAEPKGTILPSGGKDQEPPGEPASHLISM